MSPGAGPGGSGLESEVQGGAGGTAEGPVWVQVCQCVSLRHTLTRPHLGSAPSATRNLRGACRDLGCIQFQHQASLKKFPQTDSRRTQTDAPPPTVCPPKAGPAPCAPGLKARHAADHGRPSILPRPGQVPELPSTPGPGWGRWRQAALGPGFAGRPRARSQMAGTQSSAVPALAGGGSEPRWGAAVAGSSGFAGQKRL